jgi:hypothetical protein
MTWPTRSSETLGRDCSILRASPIVQGSSFALSRTDLAVATSASFQLSLGGSPRRPPASAPSSGARNALARVL